MEKVLIVLSFLVTVLNASHINIAVAANVSYAMDELKKEFSKISPNTKVDVTLGSSGKLTAQIKNGAPYQLFMAANMKYPNALYKDGSAVTKPVVYAQGGLAMLSAKVRDLSKGVRIILTDGISKIAIANPRTAPYGKAAMEAIRYSIGLNDVNDKFVYAESVSQTVSYTVSAADIGFIAKSSLYSPKMARYKKDKNWIEVDPKLYTPIKQGIVVLKNGESDPDIKAFYEFMLSQRAKKIMKDFGYIVK